MSAVVKKWLTNCIGIVMNMEPTIFAGDTMDGTIAAKVLYSYRIIVQDQYVLIVSTDNPALAFKNWKRLRLWMKVLSVECTDESICRICQRETGHALRLFYQLYLTLHDKNELHFIAQKKAVQRMHPSDTRFDVTPVEELRVSQVSCGDNPLCEPLLIKSDIVQWNQHRYQLITEQYDAMWDKYSKYIKDKFGEKDSPRSAAKKRASKLTRESVFISKEEEEEKDVDVESTVDLTTYEELVEQQENALQLKAFEENPKEAKRAINTMKKKRREEQKIKETKSYQQKILLMEQWEKLLKEQEKEFDESISTKLLKQSVFEKQMVTKMFEVRQQKHNMLLNRRFVDDETEKRREAEFMETVFLRSKSSSDEKYNYYFEKERTLELHRRLYREKLRLKAERINKMCREAMQQMVDVSLRNVEYKRKFREDQIPKHTQTEWANLFVKGKPIFDVLDEVENLVQDNEDLPESVEEIYRIEFDRQNNLDQADFENYLHNEWPWLLSELLTNYEQKLSIIERGANVLGYAVHRVLLVKYPRHGIPQRSDIPKVTTAACVNGLPDTTILPVLQKLLNKRNIRLIEMQDAINYCLNAFMAESRASFIDEMLSQDSSKAIESLKEGKKRKSFEEKERRTSLKKGRRSRASRGGSMVYEARESQTPTMLSFSEGKMSKAAELGRIGYEELHLGEPLTDALVAAMFVEFLKTLTNVNGWALINFPVNIAQAVFLEEVLTGTQVPGLTSKVLIELTKSVGDVADLKYRESKVEREARYAVLRKSKILPDPDTLQVEISYKTYLTSYIRIIHAPKEQNLRKRSSVRTYSTQISQTGDSIEEKVVIGVPLVEEPEKETDPLDEFYTEQGCNYHLFYKTFEYEAIKELAKLIIGDFSLPRKTSLELFGDTVLYVGANLPQASGAGQMVISEKEGETVEEEEVHEEEEKIETATPPPLAGEKYWAYSSVSFPEHFQLALASFWENAENVFVGDFKELFFLRRVILNAIVPYLTAIRNHMDDFITRPDNKQTYMCQFQNLYNEMDDDMRDDEEVKAEIHCRVAEFREKLWEICDNKMKMSEEERQRLIGENWLTQQALELTNVYALAMQLEIDRSCDSLQFLSDYYSGMVTKVPCSDLPLQKIIISKLSATSMGTGANENIVYILTVVDSESQDTIFHKTINSNVTCSQDALNKWKSLATTTLNKIGAYFKPGSKPVKPTSAKTATLFPTVVEPDEKVKEESVKIMDEFACAIEGEFERASMRLKMIGQRASIDLNDIFDHSKRIFYQIYDDIASRYERETQCVRLACEVLAQAVEAETPLQPELVLDGDKFYIDPDVVLFPDPLPSPELAVEDVPGEEVFTVEQLDKLIDIFYDLAPKGSMPERSFVFVLQDVVVQEAEDGRKRMVPVVWTALKPKQVSELSRQLFGDVEFVDWKDFIVYNYDVQFPSEDELLEARSKFREYDPDLTETVKDYQFYGIKLWYEKDEASSSETLRYELIKRQLFRLFQIDEDTLNYTALLLAFCKDVDVVKGFSKTLSLVVGKLACWNKEIGETFVTCVKEQRRLDELAEIKRELKRVETNKITESIVTELADHTVHICESVVIEDYLTRVESDNEEEEDEEDVEEENTRTNLSSINTDLEDVPLEELEDEDWSFATSSVLLDREISDVEIGYEASYNPPKAYFLPFEVVLTAVTASLPWHARVQSVNDHSLRDRLEAIYESCKSSTFRDVVLTHEFLNDPCFVDIMSSNLKFVVRNPGKIVAKMIAQNNVT